MASDAVTEHRIGWIGAGRMGFPMAELLLKAGARNHRDRHLIEILV